MELNSMGQDDIPAVPPILMLLHPLKTYYHTLRLVTAAVAVDSYLFPFGRPRKAIGHLHHCRTHTICGSLGATIKCLLLLLIGLCI